MSFGVQALNSNKARHIFPVAYRDSLGEQTWSVPFSNELSTFDENREGTSFTFSALRSLTKTIYIKFLQ